MPLCKQKKIQERPGLTFSEPGGDRNEWNEESDCSLLRYRQGFPIGSRVDIPGELFTDSSAKNQRQINK